MNRAIHSGSLYALLLGMVVALPLQAGSQLPPVKFKRKATYATGGYLADSVAAGDLNGDGHIDVVVANACPNTGCSGNGPGQIGVLLGNGNGTLQAAVPYSAGGNRTAAVALGDLNGDGKVDVVAANGCRTGIDCAVDDTGEVSVLLGNADGTLQAAVSYDSGGHSPRAVAIADVNGDGKPDLLVVNRCDVLECVTSQLGQLGVLLGNGNGTFQPPVSYSTGGGFAVSFAVADVNGDGILDLAVANSCWIFVGDTCNSGIGVIGILFGNGNGTFQSPVQYFFDARSAASVSTGDVNGDGHPDLVIADGNTLGYSHVAVMLNSGDGTFQPAVTHNAGLDDFSIVVADFNGDAILDIAAVNFCQTAACAGGKVSFLPGIGGGAFPAGASYAIGSSGYGATAGAISDLNADGRPDFVVSNQCIDEQTCINQSGNGSVTVLLNSLVLASTTTTLTSSANPARVNQPVTLTATIVSGRAVPDGEPVQFSIGTKTIGTGSTTNGVAVLTTSFSSEKTYTIKATYSGFDYLGPSSAKLSQLVTP